MREDCGGEAGGGVDEGAERSEEGGRAERHFGGYFEVRK